MSPDSGVLPGEHHFTISFRTDAPGVRLSRRLAEQWPNELTIILQHQFSDLAVDEVGFSVRLSFRGVPETIYIPFEAVTVFSDPAAPFGVKFNVEDDAKRGDEDGADAAKASTQNLKLAKTPTPFPPAPSTPTRLDRAFKADERKADGEVVREDDLAGKETAASKDAAASDDVGAKIVSIDAFRKKP